MAVRFILFICILNLTTIFGSEELDIECQEGESCIIECCDGITDGIYSPCRRKLINGSRYDYLSVNCNCDQNACSTTSIICPPNGCDINCDGRSTCLQMEVSYDGIIEDQGSVNITCTGQFACSKMKIMADDAYQLNLDCLSFDDEIGYACLWMDIFAENAGSVGIICNQIDIECTDCEAESWTCYQGEYYLPNSTTIKCLGKGCYDLKPDEFYISEGSLDDLTVVIYGCNDCANITECMPYLDGFVDSDYIGNFTQDYCPLPPTSLPTTSQPTTQPTSLSPTTNPSTSQPSVSCEGDDCDTYNTTVSDPNGAVNIGLTVSFAIALIVVVLV